MKRNNGFADFIKNNNLTEIHNKAKMRRQIMKPYVCWIVWFLI